MNFVASRFGKLNRGCSFDSKSQVLIGGVHHLFDAIPEWQSDLSQPYCMKMRFHQRFVGQFQTWRPHAAANHFGAPVEKVLIVAVDRAAVCDHHARLSLASRAATPLCVIRRGGRDISQMNEVQVGDVHAEFHCRRADHVRQSPSQFAFLVRIVVFPTKTPLAPFALALFDDLRCMFACFECSECRCVFAIKALEEQIDWWRRMNISRVSTASRIERIDRRRGAIAQLPHELRGVQLQILVPPYCASREKPVRHHQIYKAVQKRFIEIGAEIQFRTNEFSDRAARVQAETGLWLRTIAGPDELIGRA